MIKILPEIEFSAKCPKDKADLDVTGVVIPGMRCLADTICPSCGSRYYVDLPVSHALWYPVTLDKETAEIYEPFNVHWFSNPLREGFLNPVNSEIVPVVHKFYESDRLIIVNCLDFLYGHSLMNLLNVQRYLDNYPEQGCCVLVPTQLVHLVPDGVAEIWEFPIAIKDGWKWYPSLQSWISQQLAKRQECFLSPAYPHPSTHAYDIRRFVRDLPDISPETEKYQPLVLFNYREDRLWGRSLQAQQRHLQKLYNKLSAIFPQMAFVLIGFGDSNQILPSGAEMIDLRTDKFDVERDRLWMAYMSAADCTVGVHGSNMLLPSALAKATVELLPKSRLENTVQSFLFAPDKRDPRHALLYYRLLYGNNTLSNIRPSAVADLIASVVSFAHLNSAYFRSDQLTTPRKNLESLLQNTVYKQAVDYLHSSLIVRFWKRKIEETFLFLQNLLD